MPPRKNQHPEKDEERRIVRLLDALGFIIWSTSEGRPVFRPAGLPDLYAIHPAQAEAFVWIEVKPPAPAKSVVLPEQQLFHDLHAAWSSPPHALIGGVIEVEAWLTERGFILDGLLKPIITPAYREWHQTRGEERAKRMVKKNRLRPRRAPSP